MKIKIEGIKPHEIYTGTYIIELLREVGLEVQPELRKYDRSKTLDDVLTTIKGHPGYFHAAGNYEPSGIADIWQPNIHGKCPVDPKASLVRVRLADGREREWVADVIDWRLLPIYGGDLVTAWQFVRLAEGYEW